MSLLTRLLLKIVRTLEGNVPMSNPVSSVMFACPPNAVAALKVWMRDNCARDPESFVLARRVGVEGSLFDNALFHFAAATFSAPEIELMRPAVREGGELYILGVRVRRNMFPPAETTTNEPGKLQVVLIDVGEEIPADPEWATTRLTVDRFLEELGAPASPLVFIDPPEDVI